VWMKTHTARGELAAVAVAGKDEGAACDSMGELGRTLQGVQDGGDGGKMCTCQSAAAWGRGGDAQGVGQCGGWENML